MNQAAILWQQIRVPPIWVKHFKDWQAALNDFLKYRSLDHRGSHEFKDQLDEDDEYLAGKKAIVENWDETEFQRWEKIYLELGKFLDNKPHSLETQNGWLSKSGELIPCEYSEHDLYASVILKKRLNIESNIGGDDLLKRGWQKLQNSDWVTLYHNDWEVTQSQYNTFWDYSQVNKKRMPVDLKVK